MKGKRLSRIRALLLLGLIPFGCIDSSSSPPQPPPDAGLSGFDGGSVDSDAGAADGPLTDADAGQVGCATPTGGPTQHQGGVANETWTAATSPHVVTSDLGVTGTLTIEPCAEVRIAEKKTINVGATGKLVAEGLANQPIGIGASDAAKPFAQIRVGGGGTLRFAHATIENGGDPLTTVVDVTGTIFAQGADGTIATQPTVFVDHVTISGSKSNGVQLMDGAGFAPGSQELTVTGAAKYPISSWSRALGTLPSGKYTGNAIDEIVLQASGGAEAVQEDATMRNLGVPYRIGNSLSGGTMLIERQSAGVATLTIEAGVKVRVKKGGVIQVQRFVNPAPAQGALVVNGTAAAPVVFTSAEASPAAGDWLGIWFGLIPDAKNKIDFARVEYAGGLSSSGSGACNTPGTNDAAIRIFGLPSSAFVTNSEILSSAGHGIDRGWNSDSKPDFLPTNTFTTIAGCKQSWPRDTNGTCPGTVPCP
jgi:hypothetical protein